MDINVLTQYIITINMRIMQGDKPLNEFENRLYLQALQTLRSLYSLTDKQARDLLNDDESE